MIPGRLLTSYEGRLPLRALFEATPGKSAALNRAVCEAQGDLIIWTDDDVLVDPDWVASYAAAADRWPDAAFFGGPIDPWFDGEPPGWLRQIYPKVVGAFSAFDLGKEPRVLTSEALPYGANMAIRTSVQRRYMYDQNLGPTPGGGSLAYSLGEETAVMMAIMRDGLVGRWVPDARVRHFIPRGRQTVPYLRKHYHRYGVYLAKTSEMVSSSEYTGSPLLFGYPRWMVALVLRSEFKYQIRRLLCAPAGMDP